MEKELVDVTKKSSIVFMGKFIGLIFKFLISFIIARYMGATIYGQFMYIFTVISFFHLIFKLGLDQGLVAYIPRFNKEEVEKRNSLIMFTFIITFFVSLLGTSIFIFKSKFIARYILNNIGLEKTLLIMLPLLILLSIIKIIKGVYQGSNKIKYYIKGYEIFSSISKLIFILFFSFLGYKLYGIIISYYLSLILAIIYLLIKIKKLNLIGSFRFKYLSEHFEVLKFSFPLLMSGILAFFINRTDVFMIGYFLSEEKVGIYNIAFRVGIISNFILTSFNTVFAPMISSLFFKKEINKLESLYKVITKWIFGANLVAFFIILNFSTNIMNLFGEVFISGSLTLVLISAGQIVNAAVGPAGKIIAMTGYPQYGFYINIITIFINVILNYFLIPKYGINGAAFASLVSVATTNIFRLGFIYFKHKIHPYNLEYSKIIVSSVFSFFIIYILKTYLKFNWFIELVGLSLIYVFLFVCVFIFVFGFSSEDEIIIKKIRKRLF